MRRKIPSEEYFALVESALRERFPGEAPLRIAAFSFGAVVSSTVAPRLGARVRGVSLIGPSGFGLPKVPKKLDTQSYKLAGDDPEKMRAIMRQNLLAVMLLHPSSIDDDVLAMQQANVSLHKGMNSRDVSILDVVPDNLARLACPVQIIFGDEDQVARDELDDRLARCRAVRPDVDVRIAPNTGHWAMFENASFVNDALLSLIHI